MLVKSNFSKERTEELYRREVALILHKIIRENNLPSFSLGYCVLRGKGEFLQIYLNFSRQQEQENTLKLMNTKYLPIIKKELAKSKKFAYIPDIAIFLDKETQKIDELKKIIQEIN